MAPMGVAAPEIETELDQVEDTVPTGPRPLPELPASMDIDTMPVGRPLVATLSLVYGTVEHSARALRAARRGRGRAMFSSPLPPRLAHRRA